MTDSLIPRDKLDTISAAFRAHRDSMDLLEKAVTTSNRERIAELERDLAYARTRINEGAVIMSEARALLAEHGDKYAAAERVNDNIVNVINGSGGYASFGNSNVEVAVAGLLIERGNLRANLAECRSVNCTLQSMVNEAAKHTGDLPTTATEVAPLLAPAVVEEQGPWVVHDKLASVHGLRWLGARGWACAVDLVVPFKKRETAEAHESQWRDDGAVEVVIITLAEARKIAGVK